MVRTFSCLVVTLVACRLVSGQWFDDEEKLPGDVPSLIKLFHDEKPAVRSMAAQRLGRMREVAVAAVPELIALLNDQDWCGGAINLFVCDKASDALRRIGQPAVQPLIEALKNPNVKVREMAAETLGYMDPPPEEALQPLLPLLRDANELVRYRAVQAIGRLGKQSASVLSSILQLSHQDPDSLVRVGAIEATAAIDGEGKTAIPALIRAMKDDDPQVRSQAIVSLGKYGSNAKPAVAALTAALDDQATRYEAVSTDCCILAPLCGEAAEALGKIGPAADAALPKLHNLLQTDLDGDVRATAAQAILQINPHDNVALEVLITFAKSEEDAQLAEAALKALKIVGPAAKDAQGTILLALRHKEDFVREAAVEALAAVAGRQAVPMLTEQIEWEKRLLAAKTKSEDHDAPGGNGGAIFARIAEALGTLGADAAPAAAAIASLLDHPACWLTLDREKVVDALGEIGPGANDAVPKLIKLLDEGDDVDTELRQKTAVALGRMGPAAKAAVPRLRQLAESDIERDVRQAAREAVQEISGEKMSPKEK